ncbi:MAG TPA: DUF664 domain-containing protein [Pseudonocardiaceae bacterium]
MTRTPQHFSARWQADPRPALPLLGDERDIPTAYLDWHRQTFELKCTGIPPDRLSDRGIPPSRLSLHGMLRHLSGVERWWFRQQFAGEDLPMLYYTDEDPDQAIRGAGFDQQPGCGEHAGEQAYQVFPTARSPVRYGLIGMGAAFAGATRAAIRSFTRNRAGSATSWRTPALST